MISIEDVKNLANLARLELSEEEQASLQHDLEAILGYVDELKAFSATEGGDTSLNTSLVKNVTRADENPNETGACTADLLAEAPSVENNYVKVKAIM